MNILKALPAAMLALFFFSCLSTKKMTGNEIYNASWELEYISGPRIAFGGLFPDKRPEIAFNKATQRVEGFSGCNGYAADCVLNGENISFGEPDPRTMMYCDNGEEIFLNTTKKVNKYKIDEHGKLNLMIDNVPVMRFRKAMAQ